MKSLLSKIRFVKLSELITQLTTINQPKKEAKMLSRKLALGILLGILGLVVGGCVLYAGGVYGGPRYGTYHHPSYCYDCHRYPYWTQYYDDCTFYDFYFVAGGYYYLPRSATARIYIFRKYNWGRDKEFVRYYEKRRLDDRERVRIEKEYRGVDRRERQRYEKEYQDYDKRVQRKPERKPEREEGRGEGREEKGRR